MFGISTVCLLFLSFAGLPYGSSLETVQIYANMSCSPSETACGLGCCPLSDAECCLDGLFCCPHGTTCIPFLAICIGLENKNSETSLVSSKSTPIKNSFTTCPAGTTTCGPDRCCPFSEGICCSDGQHCCPHGYRCDVPHKKCIKSSYNELETTPSLYHKMEIMSSARLNQKPTYKSCPGSGRVCPSYMSCCITDNGDWSCCPNPSLRQLRYGDGQCCDTIIGHLCCPDALPVCTPLGCIS